MKINPNLPYERTFMRSDAEAEDMSNVQINQFPESRHGPGYDNDVPANSWLRSDGTKKPAFDMSNAWRGGKLREE